VVITSTFYPRGPYSRGFHRYNNNNNNNNNNKDVRKLDRKTRKLLTIHGQRHPKADIDRLYVSRIPGIKGLMQLEEAYAVEIKNWRNM